jgi:hypothetical protein
MDLTQNCDTGRPNVAVRGLFVRENFQFLL